LPSVPPAAGAVCLLQGFDRGPNCTASFGLQWVSFETRKKATGSRQDIAGYKGFTEYLGLPFAGFRSRTKLHWLW